MSPDTTRRSLNALPPGTVLRDYVIQSELGSGGFSIVYLARHHLKSDWLYAIKEYFPGELTVRGRDGTGVHPVSTESQEPFEDGLRRFRDEAEQLRKFRNEGSIVSCLNYFEENGTAYLVMDYDDGLPLSELLRLREEAGQPFTEEDLLAVVEPLLEGLAVVHRAGVLHRDIRPGNIFVRRQDEITGRPAHPVLIDFGAAKQNYLARHSRSRAPYTPGYAAYEQVSSMGEIGPWTDLYSVGALMWRMVAGGCPDELRLLIPDESACGKEETLIWSPTPREVEKRAYARNRGRVDPMPLAAELGAGRFSSRLLDGIDRCLTLYPEDRAQNCREVEGYLQAQPSKSRSAPPKSDRSQQQHKVVSNENAKPFWRTRVLKRGDTRGSSGKEFGLSLLKGLRKRVAALAATGLVFGSLTWLFFAALAEMRCERWNTADWWRHTNVSVETVQACLNAGADHEGDREFGYTPLHRAVGHNANPSVIEALLEGGANVNAKRRYGYTPLHGAAGSSTFSVVEMLLEAGADANAEGGPGVTPLHQAMERGELDIILALLEHGADVNADGRLYRGSTTLHWAVGRGALSVTRALLERGANANATDENGDTPLHIAARDSSSPEILVELIVEELLDAGACVNRANDRQETPWDLATNNASLWRTEVLERLSNPGNYDWRLGGLPRECVTR